MTVVEYTTPTISFCPLHAPRSVWNHQVRKCPLRPSCLWHRGAEQHVHEPRQPGHWYLVPGVLWPRLQGRKCHWRSHDHSFRLRGCAADTEAEPSVRSRAQGDVHHYDAADDQAHCPTHDYRYSFIRLRWSGGKPKYARGSSLLLNFH